MTEAAEFLGECVTMSIDQKTREALNKENLGLPPKPQVEAIESEPYEDTTGVDSLQVWVILSDSTSDDELTGENVMQISAAIRDSLLRNGVGLFPYVRFIKHADYHAQVAGE